MIYLALDRINRLRLEKAVPPPALPQAPAAGATEGMQYMAGISISEPFIAPPGRPP